VSTLSCTQVDSLQLAETRQRLEQYDTTKITENIHLYYKDLGWCYYRLYLTYKQDYYLTLSVQAYEKCVAHKPDYGPALWDLAFEYGLLKNCEKSRLFLEKYLTNTPLEYQQKEEQIKSLKGKCP
jgi:hypothetical protein